MRLRPLQFLLISCFVVATSLRLSAQNILIIWDNDSAYTHTVSLKNALVAAGYTVSMSAVSEDYWDNTNPSVNGFDGVIRMNGTTYSGEMPTNGQTALVSYVSNGGAYVHFEWDAYQWGNSQMQSMEDLILFVRNSGAETAITLTEVSSQSAHPVLVDVPSSFSLTTGYNVGAMRVFSTQPSTLLMADNNGNDALAIREFGSGQVLGFHHSGNYGTYTPLSDTNVQQIIINFFGEAAGCGLNTSVTTTHVSCFGAADGHAVLNINGDASPFDIEWSTSSTDTMITELTPGTYSVTVTDTNECVSIDSFEITEPTQITDSFMVQNIVCEFDSNGGLEVYPSGGVGPYTYLWSNGSTNMGTGGLTHGWHYVTITDSTNCSVVDSFVVAYTFLSPHINIADSFGVCVDWPLTLDAENPGSVYSWSTGDTTQTIVVSDSGNYSIQVTNTDGCITVQNFTVSLYTCVGIDEIGTNISLNVYPNPANDMLQFESVNASLSDVKLSLVSLRGDVIFNTSINTVLKGQSNTIDISSVAAGTYMLHVESTTHHGVHRVVVQ